MPDRRLRVLEFARGVAGPACGRLFAGLGHDVIKLEVEPGDFLRRQPPFNAEGTGLAFVALNADKRSYAVNDKAELIDALPPLLKAADVFVVDLLPAEAAALGLTAERLHRDWPGLVVVWITAFGRDGDFSDVAGDSLLAESYGGLATMIGEASKRPLSLGGEQAAYSAGVTGFFSAVIALLRRDQGFGGDIVDVAMCDVAAYMDWKSDVARYLTGAPPSRSSSAGGEWKMVRASDGWVGVIFQQRHWAAVVDLVGDPALRDPRLTNEVNRLERAAQWWPVIERWAADKPAKEIYERAQALGLPFGWAVRASDLLRSDQMRHRGFISDPQGTKPGLTPAVGSPAHSDGLVWLAGCAPTLGGPVSWDDDSERSTDAVTERSGPAADPLAGVTVLDFGTITAGAAATRLLADFGAAVVKVEWIERPDTFRGWKVPQDTSIGARPNLDSPYFPSNNVGKMDVAIDMKRPEGRDLIHQLAGRCQVVVENFRVGVTERLGIDPASLAAVNPALIYLSLSSQGHDGPEARNTSFGSTLDLLSGLASVTGYEADHPIWSSSDVNYPDQLVSLMGAAFVAYTVWAGRTGVHLDVSQREVVTWTLDALLLDCLVTGSDPQPQGNRRPGRCPHETFPAQGHDRWLAVSCSDDRERAALAECIGAEDLAGRDVAWWEANQGAVYEIISAWTSKMDRDAAVAKLREAEVAAVPVLDASDRARTPRFRDHLVTMPGTPFPVKGFPSRFSAYRMPLHLRAPVIGEDTERVLADLVGLSRAEIARLDSTGVVHLASGGER